VVLRDVAFSNVFFIYIKVIHRLKIKYNKL